MKTIILLVLSALVMPSVAGAQPSQSAPIRVTLVAGPAPSKGGRTEVLRRAQRAPQDLVIVDRNATAEDLAAALAMMNALRVQYGDSQTEDFRARPEVSRPGPTWQNSSYRTWLVAQLARLRSASPAQLADLGTVRSVQITLPAPRGAITHTGGRE